MKHSSALRNNRHGIVLRKHEAKAIGPYVGRKPYLHDKLIDESVVRIGALFEEVRKNRSIPLAELRKDVIPMVHAAADGTDVFGLFASLQAKDDYTDRHHIAVGAIATLIGSWIGLTHQECLQLTTAALLHDVGKVFIPKGILHKPGELTEEEYDLMKSHTVMGYELIKDTVGANHRQALVALQHHERMDGSGYPFGIAGGKIDLFSRIVSVADVFHAMSSRRVYRGPSPFYEVLFQMEHDAFGTLDPAITRLFIEKIMGFLIGHRVLLTSGQEGTILMIHPHDPTHPLVQAGNEFIDLSKHLSVHIERIF